MTLLHSILHAYVAFYSSPGAIFGTVAAAVALGLVVAREATR